MSPARPLHWTTICISVSFGTLHCRKACVSRLPMLAKAEAATLPKVAIPPSLGLHSVIVRPIYSSREDFIHFAIHPGSSCDLESFLFADDSVCASHNKCQATSGGDSFESDTGSDDGFPTANANANDTVMVTVAIAGAGTLAGLLAHHISQSANPVLVLSRVPRLGKPRPAFEYQYDCQVAVVNYGDSRALQYALRGVDLVISTFRGPEQINLVKAARSAGVRRFVPAEFEGSLDRRPPGHRDPLDFGSAEARQLLQHYANSRSRNMQWTAFSCGIFYERFGPGGLGPYGMGASSCVANQGDYLIDVGEGAADIVELNADGRSARICMTSLDDVARFVAAAVELGVDTWPREYKMRGDRMSVRDLFALCSRVRGVGFSIRTRPYSQLAEQQRECELNQDWSQWMYIERLRATADGRPGLKYSGPE
ncbi:NAD(P)-binding protein [Sodiomyces alkalinus F11]|uniref:NAD(P)-binding protein n=1 Tax=Sodiomyces alkalinus (strain CBS 110278 / VKM F-3762 / F11) TaxID=1314773 RepID=A0A3N2Q414_SODAK|nr:NAD(P)-binding protein [Sodiomyces alkalinus F11]ROT41456.1 NAD(P)-binding protein [Sodiomyces alkalinus F11]